jgi:hypothetical protein
MFKTARLSPAVCYDAGEISAAKEKSRHFGSKFKGSRFNNVSQV